MYREASSGTTEPLMSIPVRPARRLFSASLVAAAALAGGARASDTQVLLDGTFGAGMTSVKILDTTPGAAATFTSATTSFGGPSGDWR